MEDIIPISSYYANYGKQSIFQDTEESLREEIQFLLTLVKQQQSCINMLDEDMSDTARSYLVVAVENNWESLTYVMGRLFTKIHNLGYKTYKKIRDKIDDNRGYITSVTHAWESRIKNNLNNITTEMLGDKDLELFSVDDWIQAAKVNLRAFEFCTKLKDVCSDQNTEMMTNYMKEIKSTLNNLGIDISISRLSANYEDFLDKRSYKSIDALGYYKSTYPNLFRYMHQIASYIPKIGQTSPLTESYNTYISQLTNEAAAIKSDFTKGKIKKENGEYQARNDRLLNQMVRAGYCYCILGVAFEMSRLLLKDITKMFSSVEDMITIKK